MSENNVPNNKTSSSARLKKIMEEDCRMVTGIFRFNECPGGETPVPMKKYPGQERLDLHLKDGETYTVPLWVARWLNGYDACAVKRNGKINSCGYPRHENSIDRVTGRPLVRTEHYRRRMAFESNEFMTV